MVIASIRAPVLFYFHPRVTSSRCVASHHHVAAHVSLLLKRYVTWEIAPGLLVDGSIVDVWGRKDVVNWNMPGAGAPCTSTSRPGRWRSFPYLAEFDGEDAEVLWGYLCTQWNTENNVSDESGENAGRKLVKFNFFMLQADVLPNMAFSSTRKRLIYSHDCIKGYDNDGGDGGGGTNKEEEESSQYSRIDNMEGGSNSDETMDSEQQEDPSDIFEAEL